MKTRSSRLINWIRGGVDVFLVVSFLIMFGAVLLQVAIRTFTTYSLVGTEEIANYAQLWLVLVGSGVALRFGKHVAVDILVSFLSERTRFYISLFNAAAILWFLWLVFQGSLPLIDMGTFQTSPALGLPMWTMYASLSVGAAYMALELILSLLPGDEGNPPPETAVSDLN